MQRCRLTSPVAGYWIALRLKLNCQDQPLNIRANDTLICFQYRDNLSHHIFSLVDKNWVILPFLFINQFL